MLDLARDPRDLGKTFRRPAVGTQQSRVHLLLPKGACRQRNQETVSAPCAKASHAHSRSIPGSGAGSHGAQLTGPGCCSMTQKRPPPQAR